MTSYDADTSGHIHPRAYGPVPPHPLEPPRDHPGQSANVLEGDVPSPHALHY